MKLRFVHIGSKNPQWLEDVASAYDKKMNRILKFQRDWVKSPSLERESADQKRSLEGKALLKQIADNEHVVLLDEKGKDFRSSMDFSNKLVKSLSGSSAKVTVVVGGPYGFDDSVRERANETWSLSKLTLNHHLAQAAGLEQIYRGLAIWKNLPYHND